MLVYVLEGEVEWISSRKPVRLKAEEFTINARQQTPSIISGHKIQNALYNAKDIKYLN